MPLRVGAPTLPLDPATEDQRDEVEEIVTPPDNPNQLLKDLADALNNAFISTWQSTDAWQKQLDAANTYLEKLK